jgi:leucyl-tRNA synthetase
VGRLVLVRVALSRPDERSRLLRSGGGAVLDGAAKSGGSRWCGPVCGWCRTRGAHLLYARFWHKVLYDLGHASSWEPYRRLYNQGYIQADAYRDPRGQVVEAAEVTETEDGFRWRGQPVRREFAKMGKSLKNSVNPDQLYAEYGADTFRPYEMSMAPLDVSRPWETRAVVGMFRFLQRLWRNLVDEHSGELRVHERPGDDTTRRLLHQTIAGVREDLTDLRVNTAVAKLITLNNHLTGLAAADSGSPREVAEPLVLMIAPFTPHIAEELWARLGHVESLAYAAFPTADPALITAEQLEYPMQVNGKVRARLRLPADTEPTALQDAALQHPRVIQLLGGAAPAQDHCDARTTGQHRRRSVKLWSRSRVPDPRSCCTTAGCPHSTSAN